MRKSVLILLLTVTIIALMGVYNLFENGTNMIKAQGNEPAKEKKEITEIKLPPAKTVGKMTLEEAIPKRKSVRKYAPKEMSIEQVSQILWAAYGANPRNKNFISRNVPSAGGIFPMNVYLLDKNGIYRYDSLNHSLILVKKGDARADLCNAATGQGSIKEASIDLVITGDFAKCANRYGERAPRYVAMEAGHIGQNVSLQAVALGLDTVMIGAFVDEAVAEVISAPKEETPLYIIPVGYAAE